MPPVKKTTIKQMEAKVEALESEISEVRTTLADVQNAVRENHANLLAMLEKCLGKTMFEEEGPGGSAKGTPANTPLLETKESKRAHTNRIREESLAEFRHAVKKVELPSFTGEDPAGWISRAEIYFRVQDTTPEIKVRLAQLCMEGPTIHFFNSLIGENEDLSWENLKDELLGRYGGHGEGDVYEQLTELKQEGTVDEYITEFEYLTTQIPRLPDKQFLGYFLHGLKTEIRGKVRSLAAMGEMSRTKLLQVTRAVEKEIKGTGSGFYRGSKSGNGLHRPSSHGSGKGSTDWVMVKGQEEEKRSGVGPKGDKMAHNDKRRNGPRERGFTHLSYQEMMERKQKGLCFKCGGAFHPMHKCPEKHLKILVLEDDDDKEAEAKVIAVEVEESDEDDKAEMCVLNLNHIAYENHKTVKLQGRICGVPVLILVDSGATHNFVSQKLVHKMEWSIEETPSLSIKLGDGSRSQSQGVVKGLELNIGEFKLSPEMHLFELGGIDVVLGMEWLKTLGDMIVNWRLQTMSFWSNKKWVVLQGIDGCERELVALQCILSKPKFNKPKELWGMDKRGVEGGTRLTAHQHKELGLILEQYAQVFQEPFGLPPRRNKEHAINLLENHGAVNVRPYRYPHHHKNEIEKQVQEMLAAGVIRHSTSSFSSPVILVKKKDNTWRMFIDYRALNKVTVPDKFPIPVIEELLDELHGANFYSKLDLKSGYHQVRVKESDIGKTAFRTRGAL